MSKRYTSGVVSSTSPTVNAAGASGVFTLNQQSAAQSTNNWPPYKVEKSLRFRSSASGYLSRTPASAGNRKTWTWSGWVKRGALANGVLLGTETVLAQDYCTVYYVSDKIYLDAAASNIETMRVYTNAVFRDPSAWYHVVVYLDTTQATAANRTAIYVNGVLQTLTVSTNPAQNLQPSVNSTVAHNIGRNPLNGIYFDGYMAEINFVDGQALTPSSFGGTDKDGNWSPIAYTGSYGTNGFYLNFKDVTSATTTGYDYSGNGNNWTLSGFNVSTANTSYDSMIDVPEDQSGSSSSNVRGNYATLNPLSYPSLGSYLSRGNLSLSGQDYQWAMSTIGVNTGKWYWEVYVEANTYPAYLGVINAPFRKDNPDTSPNINSGTSYIGGLSSGTTGYYKNYTSGSSSSQTGLTQNATWGFALDVEAGTLAYYVANTLVHTDTTLTSDGSVTYWPMVGQTYTASNSWTRSWFNFGQQPFAYAPPSGFKALNTFNLPEPTIKQPNKYFDATLYTGTGANQSITNAGGFQPDFVWTKSRNGAFTHLLFDAIRGVSNYLITPVTDAEATLNTTLTAFNSNGFSIGTNSSINNNTSTFVGWQWNAGGANTTNTSGSITSIVRANPTAGFSIVTYTGTGANATVGHGLGVAPSMIIVKSRVNAYDWVVYNSNIGNTKKLYLNLTDASVTDSTAWNNTSATSSVFSLGSNVGVNQSSSTYVAYCFAQVAGYSAFGSYTGNGSTDGPFIYTGFRPKFVMAKSSSAVASWFMLDTARNTYNAVGNSLYANLSVAEDTGYYVIDALSNGFKLRSSYVNANNNGDTYIYAAFAETPFKYARSR